MIDRLICSRLWGALVVLFAAAGFSAVCALALANPAGAALPSNCSKAGSRVTCTFSFSGSEQAFRVPQGVGSVRVVAVGASGGGGVGVEPGGAGAVVSGTLSVSGGESLYVEVGGAGGQAGRGGTPGFNGGGTGNGDAGGGGGASDVRTAPRSAGLSPDRRVLIAAGGGGAGQAGGEMEGGCPAVAGVQREWRVATASLPLGSARAVAVSRDRRAGAATAGPPARRVMALRETRAAPGRFGQGGDGATSEGEGYGQLGGGGGGGLYGGGGGGSGAFDGEGNYAAGGGGGGGSSLAPAGGSVTANENNLPPEVTISYAVPTALLTTPRPDNHFTVSDIKTNRDGTITFAVKVPGPGAIDVLETAWNNDLARAAVLLQPAAHRFVFARAHTTAHRASTLHLRVTPDARGRLLVHHHTYPVTLRLWVSYTRTGVYRSIGFDGLHLPR